jgi:iron complex transport system substrate-binding protein
MATPADDDPHCNSNTDTIRIVSLLPSITEILSSIGVANQIVGITHECDYPPEAIAGAKIVTTSEITPYTMTQDEINTAVCGSLVNGHSLYGLDSAVLRSVKPDIIFTQSLCDVCAVSYPVVLETCARIMAGGEESESGPGSNGQPSNDKDEEGEDTMFFNPKLISMEPNNLVDVMKTIHVAGKALGPNYEKQADIVVSKLERGFETIRETVYTSDTTSRPKVAFLEWHTPIFTGGHWIPDMIQIAGGAYHMCQSGDRSAAITDDDFISLDPDVILIGPCGFSLERSLDDTLAMYKKRDWWKDLRAVKQGRVYALDGNSYYARPGPRLLQGTGIMAACIHGEEVAQALGEELAPSSGWRRVTLDMYESSSIATSS